MNYNELSGKSILLLGKTRSLSGDEFETLLKLHSITLQKSFTQGVALIVEGKFMNPLEQNESERLYELRAAPIVDITVIEKWLCTSIEPNRLLMSLKLSRDAVRLVDFIKNPHITSELFFKLLKLYDWSGEGLFDNDRNRDVTAAIIGRFYVDIERNHNVQYAMSGLAHLVEKYGNTELITAISQLSPIAKELKNPNDATLNGVLDAMALHSDTPEPLLQQLLKERAKLLAYREPLVLEKELLALEDETIQKILAQNITLSQEGADLLEKMYPELISQFTPLDEVRFRRLIPEYGVYLASNVSLNALMQQNLMEIKNETVFSALARNPALLSQHLEQLFTLNEFDEELASNPSLSTDYLKKLYERGEDKTLKALSANVSTPVNILHQLSLDLRYARYVKTNAAFGKHIQMTNIGWNV